MNGICQWGCEAKPLFSSMVVKGIAHSLEHPAIHICLASFRLLEIQGDAIHATNDITQKPNMGHEVGKGKLVQLVKRPVNIPNPIVEEPRNWIFPPYIEPKSPKGMFLASEGCEYPRNLGRWDSKFHFAQRPNASERRPIPIWSM